MQMTAEEIRAEAAVPCGCSRTQKFLRRPGVRKVGQFCRDHKGKLILVGLVFGGAGLLYWRRRKVMKGFAENDYGGQLMVIKNILPGEDAVVIGKQLMGSDVVSTVGSGFWKSGQTVMNATDGSSSGMFWKIFSKEQLADVTRQVAERAAAAKLDQ